MPALFPPPLFDCPFLPGSCRTAVLAGPVVMYWSLSQIVAPHSRDRAFPLFYLQLLFYVVSCYSQLTKINYILSQMSVESKGAFNQDASHLGRGWAEVQAETP